MPNKIITISREFGSGGRVIAEKLAKELGFCFYDKTLIDVECSKEEFSENYLVENEDLITHSFLFNIAVYGYYPEGLFHPNSIPGPDSIYLSEAKVIKKIAERESAIIVGRCADYILKDNDRVMSVFIYSDKESKLKRLVGSYGVDSNDAEKEMKKRDKERSHYYKKYTGQSWGDRKNYHLVLNSDFLGEEGTIKLLKELIENKFNS